MRPIRFALALSALLSLTAMAPAHAAVVDGRLDPDYGPALSPQTTQTSSAKNTPGFGGPDSTSWSFGSELDGAYAFVSGGALHLFFAGNLMSYLGEFDHRRQLQLFVDMRPGGQHQLRSDNAVLGYSPDSGLNRMAGLTFDAGFAADWWFNCLVVSVGPGSPPVRAYTAELLDAGSDAGSFLGSGFAGGTGALSGGSNPAGILVTIDDSNSSGIASGCLSASGGAAVSRGMECEIPLSALGNPAGAIRVCAFVNGVNGNAYLDNQVLGPLPAGICFLGNPAGVDFGALAGDQFFTIDGPPVPARAATWGRVKAAYR